MGAQQALLQEPIGDVIIHVLRGRDLKAMDFLSSDPYVCVGPSMYLGDYSKCPFRTKCKKKTLNPVWMEKFVVPVSSVDDPFLVQVWDKDKHSADDDMGHCMIDLSLLTDEKKRAMSLILSSKGEVDVEIQFKRYVR